MQRVVEAAERTKILLSRSDSAQISLPFISSNEQGPLHIEMVFSRGEFDTISKALLERCEQPVLAALKMASFGMEKVDEVLLVGGSTRIPAVQSLVQKLTGKSKYEVTKLLRRSNPDEVVALGAAVQAGVLSGECDNMVLIDVTPLSLGLEVIGGVTFVLIPRNSTVPVVNSQNFTTATDGQTTVEINVVQGEREMVIDNKSIGIFRLSGLVAAPSGKTTISVSFDIDVNGILGVSAIDIRTGQMADITITGASTMAKETVERLVQVSKEYSEQDKTSRQVQQILISCRAIYFLSMVLICWNRQKISEELQDEVQNTSFDVEEAASNREVQRAEESLQRMRKLF